MAGTYNGVAEPAVPGRVAPRALLGRPGVVEDEERRHRSESVPLRVREEETAPECLPEQETGERELSTLLTLC